MYHILYWLIGLSLQKGCLNDEGTYQINVKIYMDRDSRHAIINYTHANLPHEFTDHIEAFHNEFESAHIKHYFGVIFNEVNRTLRGTNVQFKADFSDLFKHEFSEIQERYCGYFSNITAIAESFLGDFENSHENGENKILIVDCSHNNAFLPTSSHVATKNQCGKVHGILMTDPEVVKNVISEGLYKIFTTKSISQVQGMSEAVNADICTYVQFCNRNYDYTGVFIRDLGVLTHKTLTDGGVNGLGYKIGHRFVKNFGHDNTHNFEFEDSNYAHHGHMYHEDANYHRSKHHSGNRYLPKYDDKMDIAAHSPAI